MRKSRLKGAISLFSVAAMLASTICTGWGADSALDVVRAEDDDGDKIYFLNGVAGGDEFAEGENNWIINTLWDTEAQNGPLRSEIGNSNSAYNAAIVANNHGDGEKIIRLINGVDTEEEDLKDNPDYFGTNGVKLSDYRAGTAFYNQRFTLTADDGFSAKFTISMPDAWACDEQTYDENGDSCAREVGGDGIAFVITSQEANAVNGQAGGGIGYQGVDNSIIIELDSFYNGAYATCSKDSTGYINWGYDNQLYLDQDGNYYGDLANYWNNLADTTFQDYITNGFSWETTMMNYQQLAANKNQRFDHVGIMFNGDPKTHEDISYLSGNDPTKIQDGNYVNLTGNTSGAASTRFTDTDVDNRLFTVWVDYKNETLEVRYALGDYENAVRPETAQLTYDDLDADKLADIFGSDEPEVCIGFTSAIGSSKANHTVHSIYFSNFVPTYEVNYWVECDKPSGASDTDTTYTDADDNEYKKVNDTWYQLTTDSYGDDSEVNQEISPKALTNTSYQDYTLTSYSIYDDAEAAPEIKTYTGSQSGTDLTGTVSENNLTIDLYYNAPEKTAGYTVNYWVECDEPSTGYDTTQYCKENDVWYQKVAVGTAPADTATSTANSYTGTAAVNTVITPVTLKDGTTYDNYVLTYSKINDGSMTGCSSESDAKGTVTESGLTIHLYYKEKTADTTTYTVKHWKEYDPDSYTPDPDVETKTSDGKNYYLADASDMNATAGDEITPNDIRKNDYTTDGYDEGTVESFTKKTVANDGSTEVNVYYDLEPIVNQDTTYVVEYWKEYKDSSEVPSGAETKTVNGKTYYKTTDSYRKDDVIGTVITKGQALNSVDYTSDGYKVSTTAPTTVDSITLDADASKNVFSFYYDKVEAEDYVYYVNYYIQSTPVDYDVVIDGKYYKKVPVGAISGSTTTGSYSGVVKLNESVTANTLTGYDYYTYTSYNIDGGSQQSAQSTMPTSVIQTNGQTINLFYNYKNEKTDYVVEYWVQNADGSWTKHSQTVSPGATGELVKATIIDINGYSHTVTPSNATAIEQGYVLPDGSLVLKVYYTYETPKAEAVQTGDNDHPKAAMILFAVSILGFGICQVFRKKVY